MKKPGKGNQFRETCLKSKYPFIPVDEDSVRIRKAFRFVVAAGLLASTAACSIFGKTEAPVGTYHEKYSRFTALMSVMFQNQQMPEGVNHWGCKPAPGKGNVVLIHGTFSSTMLSYGALGPRLANAGYCVYARDFGAKDEDDWFKGMDSVEHSAREIGVFIDKIIRSSGNPTVDLIGHSQGGLIGFYLIKIKGYESKINRFIAMAPSVSGTSIASEPDSKTEAYCRACTDQHPDSEVIRKLHDGPVTRPGVKYTILATRNDYIVRPIEKQFVLEPDVQNLYIQDRYPGKFATHSNMLYDNDVLNLVLDLLRQPN